MKNLALIAASAATALLAVMPAGAANITEPTVFSSSRGVLDLMMIAQPTRVTGLTDGATPVGWAYQICYRPASGNACPPNTPTPYGGVRLAMQPGDLLKIRFVNKLPPVPAASVDRAAYDPLLALNPTNLHTHGLIVDATPNSNVPPAVPVYGDFVFTSIFNPANGDPASIDPATYSTLHAHGDVVSAGFVDYKIQLPPNHPQGAFWFHPHMHGIAVNQLSAGLSGIITVGSAANYACGDFGCRAGIPENMVRHLILKEMQIAGGTPQYQTDAGLCTPTPAPGEVRNGSCPADPAAYPKGGVWYYTVNGQQFPTIPIARSDGEVWRLQNASASATYDISLVDDATKASMIMQLLSLDGVSVNVPAGTQPGDIVALGGHRFKYVACPTKPASNLVSAVAAALRMSRHGANSPAPICVTELFMMPSSRAELFVSYRDASGRLAPAPAGASATLMTSAYATGPIGDTWPQMNLAKVQFPFGGTRSLVGDFVKVHGFALRDRQAGGIFAAANAAIKPAPTPAACAPLPAGHRRRIYFGNPGTGSDPKTDLPLFGLGYEELDQNGKPVPGTLVDITSFDPANLFCLPLNKGNQPVTEVWELINLTGELHNFHIHQTKFKIVSTSAPAGSVLASNSPNGAGIEEDNVPLPYVQPVAPYALPDSGSCAIADFKAGKCKASPVVVSIPFSRVGRFVYHCHVLEHEDGGMMHTIRVVPSGS